jgi:hypothetical protein
MSLISKVVIGCAVIYLISLFLPSTEVLSLFSKSLFNEHRKGSYFLLILIILMTIASIKEKHLWISFLAVIHGFDLAYVIDTNLDIGQANNAISQTAQTGSAITALYLNSIILGSALILHYINKIYLLRTTSKNTED